MADESSRNQQPLDRLPGRRSLVLNGVIAMVVGLLPTLIAVLVVPGGDRLSGVTVLE